MQKILEITREDSGKVSLSTELFDIDCEEVELAHAIEDELYVSGYEGLRAAELVSLALLLFRDVIHIPEGHKPKNRITAQMSANPELFEKLRAWRKVKAEEIDRPPFVIFHNKVLLELADIAPATEEALGTVKGIGPAKLERYGADILAITKEFTSLPE